MDRLSFKNQNEKSQVAVLENLNSMNKLYGRAYSYLPREMERNVRGFVISYITLPTFHNLMK